MSKELTPDQLRHAQKVMTALAKAVPSIPRSGKNPGIVVEEIATGRMGVIYWKEQTKEFGDLKKFLVHFEDKDEPVLKSANRLKQCGFVD